ncbi:calcium-binding protein [Novosphingobium sp.]|uniref:calcium-binding protein n=1 Tax=Novosphingobium sp. TaxID=1874826 RepID=UPI0038B81370
MTLQVAGNFVGGGFRHDLGATDNLYVPAGVVSISTDTSAVHGVGRGRSVDVFGAVHGETSGISLETDRSDNTLGGARIYIGRQGTVTANGNGLYLTGYGNNVVNYGEIQSETLYGIAIEADRDSTSASVIRNYGAITGYYAGVSGGQSLMTIYNHGTITGLYGSAIVGGVGDDTVFNYGTIEGSVNLFDGSDRVVNRGLIIGDYYGGDNSDTFDNRSGTIDGLVDLGNGSDTFVAGSSDEYVSGGGGLDTLDFTRSSGVQVALDLSLDGTGWAAGDTYSLFENVRGSATGADVLVGDVGDNVLSGLGGNDQLFGQDGADLLYGGRGNDTLDGGSGEDVLNGDVGNDILRGGAGSDTLDGGAGNDTLTGGAGKDYANGGAGADRFVFAKGDLFGVTISDADVINDFQSSQGDRIDLSLLDASTKATGDQAFQFIGTAAFHNVAGELRISQSDGATYVLGDTNGDGTADFRIALTGLLTLKAADFVL